MIDPKLGNKVLILHPAYVAGKIGVICGQEVLSGDETNARWLIQVDAEDIMVSLAPKEFKVITDDFEGI
ncbi:hypothetical protein WA1_33220 [Scytonema hofmannii PCC 7110]|uniref:Uncharacterized protein n=1 Tax=Scytonema hofmannii PCC 7110 TaxID=128403 RepID=A0A139X2I5_9CYAN|nr:hypothetical protein [Scytonema hofmannii]KYC38876.1 hypothetical protein WA1_33220 [Scytonema hofmannii PCC 7110]